MWGSKFWCNEKFHHDRQSWLKIQDRPKIKKLKPSSCHLDFVHSEVCFINLGQMSPQRSWLLPPVAIKQSAYVSSLWPPAWTWVMKTKMKRLSWTMSAFSWLECCTGRGAVDVTLFSPTRSWEASHPSGNLPLLNPCLAQITKHFTQDGGPKAWWTKNWFKTIILKSMMHYTAIQIQSLGSVRLF